MAGGQVETGKLFVLVLVLLVLSIFLQGIVNVVLVAVAKGIRPEIFIVVRIMEVDRARVGVDLYRPGGIAGAYCGGGGGDQARKVVGAALLGHLDPACGYCCSRFVYGRRCFF